MELLYKSEHLKCRNYDNSNRPIIEVVKALKNEKNKLSARCNEMIFVIDGLIRYCFKDYQPHEAVKGQILFRPAGTNYSYEVVDEASVIIFRLHEPITFCDAFSIEKLYNVDSIKPNIGDDDSYKKDKRPKHISILESNSRIDDFLDGIININNDGVRCRCWFELKIKELFMMLRFYYPKKALQNFFKVILSGDTAFSEYVRINWAEYLSVQKLADSLNMTRKQFTTRFVRVFGNTPKRWMSEKRAEKAFTEITSTQKTFKQISLECGFSTDTELIRFCKKQFHKVPTEIRNEEGKGII